MKKLVFTATLILFAAGLHVEGAAAQVQQSQAPSAQVVDDDVPAANIHVEVTVTGTGRTSDTETVDRRTVQLTVAEGRMGRIRAAAEQGIDSPTPVVPAPISVFPLNVDVTPQLLEDGRILLMLSLQISMPHSTESPRLQVSIQDSMTVVLDSGEAMVVAQSADPVSDMQVTVEAKATILE